MTRRGAVSWQGFSPGRRDLAARLTLDPLIEAEHLPLSIKVTFTGTAGTTSLDGGRIPSAGTVTVTLSNATSQPADLPTAADASVTEQQCGVLPGQIGRPIVSGSKYGCDQPPCAQPPSRSSSAPPGSRSEQ